MKRFRLKEEFSYYADSEPTYWIVEEKLWCGWKNAYASWKNVYASGFYYRTSESFTYEEASMRLNNLVRDEKRRHENVVRHRTFKPKVLYPPLPDKEPV